MSWNDHEPTGAVQQARDDLEGYRLTADDSGTSHYFDDYASLLAEDHAAPGPAGFEDGVAQRPAQLRAVEAESLRRLRPTALPPVRWPTRD
ncbi:hypothetical protein AVL59_09645 [Streptomyces griseochromogenes]|uniref:Uncharacterized protein n=1 Tax=Streptomyces griseochromogenes TaxID=68214 RepID=A0A1B1ATJ3_9ACTN|nr:hypothetical protein AVL59_09645 [Streptomyces griseochromogenes]